ncbi:MAG: hypothetical protein COV74_02075 [Candidatus Omnitrophica bacterium CG11_big_fil_rev_8_21_14_0_20_45_26]|uniref:t-SNARE coiled-coil homology domain-containing protein n=1 Tax=Candidatus Abzuiibacterium crystallinum TaxID=1974748 RepID=A0A2H0LTU6_9BACT|nr:MAG: hypothetical protein COV74_02075 [Candidatus Omnitrophica bacterium CG11_big_fil_rev_8_21_14_0_20_45_26]PIW63307.1 MAG: hypothetical protein COW12_10875 [Candidatus Omnitrophica bacterium CG12_big_fil_rev_8_21_14_0_65_45_16]
MTSQENRIPNEREFKVILEDIYSQFRIFGEGLTGVNGRLDGMEQRLDRMEVRLDRMEVRLDRMEVRLDRMEGRLDRVEGDLQVLKSDMSFVKIVLKTVATKDDLLVIDRRLTALENR